MIHDSPWFMMPSNLVAIICFLYISGFLVSSVCFHGFITKKKLENNEGTTLSSKESFYWMLFSIFWFLFGFVCFYYLVKSLLIRKGEDKNENV